MFNWNILHYFTGKMMSSIFTFLQLVAKIKNKEEKKKAGKITVLCKCDRILQSLCSIFQDLTLVIHKYIYPYVF